MGASYNFDDSNIKFVKRIRLTRLSLILLLITSGLLIITSLLSIFLVGGNDGAGIVIWVIELLSLFINIPALFMLLFGLDELRDKIDNTKKSPLRFAIIFLGIYTGYYILSTIIMLIAQVVNYRDNGLLIAKNLMCFIFISISFIFISLSLNKMRTQGYPTKLLLSPLISLPLIAVVGFILGWVEVFYNSIGGSYYDFAIYVIITFIYLALALFGSLVELFIAINKLHNEILLNLAPELLLKKENKKKKEKSGKAAVGK